MGQFSILSVALSLFFQPFTKNTSCIIIPDQWIRTHVLWSYAQIRYQYATLKVMQMSYRRVDVKPNCFPKDVLQTWKVCISLNCPQLFHYNTCIAWCTYYGGVQWLTLFTFDWMRQQCHSCSMLNGTLVWPFALTTSLFVYLYIISTLFLLCFIYHRLLSSFVYLPSISNCVYLTFTTTSD